MYEMLGNQYFLARRYENAVDAYKKVLNKDNGNKSVRRRLIICYSQVNRIDEALDVFISLVEDDVDYIINTDPVGEDCPCPELVSDLENKLDKENADRNVYVQLGMLWLFCSPKKSIDHFATALSFDPDNGKLKHVHQLLVSHFNHMMTDESIT